MRANLTDVLLRAIEPPHTGTLTLWDTNLKHFGIRVSCGGAKSFVVLMGSGRRHAIGRYPTITLAQARTKARQILAERVLGRFQPQTITWDAARDEFLAHVERENRPRTHTEYTRVLKRCFPFGSKRLTEITKTDIARKLDLLNHAPAMRGRALVYCKAFLNWTVERGYLENNPCKMKTPKVTRRESVG
jgi:Arm domain-containing DNA-binding protein